MPLRIQVFWDVLLWPWVRGMCNGEVCVMAVRHNDDSSA